MFTLYFYFAAAWLPDFSREAANTVRKVANFVTQCSKASYSKVTLTPLYP